MMVMRRHKLKKRYGHAKKPRVEEVYVEELRPYGAPDALAWIVVDKFPWPEGRDKAYAEMLRREGMGRRARMMQRGHRERSYQIGERHKV
jgi:hypothetical protein